MSHALILAACPTKESAKTIASKLVEERLAACVQMLPIDSVYLWQGRICDGSETLLLIKSKAERFEAISAQIQALHPYEVPEIILLPITDGLPSYLAWIDNCTK